MQTFLLSIFRISSPFSKNQQTRLLYLTVFLSKVTFLSLKLITCLQVPNSPFFGIIFYNENDW